jgi:hypothetical protein
MNVRNLPEGPERTESNNKIAVICLFGAVTLLCVTALGRFGQTGVSHGA